MFLQKNHPNCNMNRNTDILAMLCTIDSTRMLIIDYAQLNTSV